VNDQPEIHYWNTEKTAEAAAVLAARPPRNVIATSTVAQPDEPHPPWIKGHCPACRRESLFVADGGYVTCSHLECPDPEAASTLLERQAPGDTTPAEEGNADRRYWNACYDQENL
jgi:hypothetical protein